LPHEGDGAPPRLFSNKDLVQLIVPMLIEQFLTFALGMVDIIMVASLGEEAVSGVSLVNTLSDLVMTLLAALSTGGAVVCAHYVGNRNAAAASSSAQQLIYTTVALSLIMTIPGLIFRTWIVGRVFGQINGIVMRHSNVYFFYMLLSYPFIALYNACAALFRAEGNSSVSMYASFLGNSINIGGNALCIYGLHMGVEGVAIPTLVSRVLAAVLLVMLLYRSGQKTGKTMLNIRGLFHIHLDFKIIKHILAIGVPNGIENSMFQIGKVLVLSIMTMFGTTAIAANAAAGTLASFNTLPGTAVGMALLTVVGQCLGAKRPDESVYFTKRLMLAAYVSMWIINIPLLLCGPQLVGLFHLSPETARLALHMYIFHGISACIIWPFAFPFANSLRAANDARFTMLVSLISMWAIRVGFCYLFAWYTDVGGMGIWYAMILDWCVRAVAFIIRFKQGRWRLHYALD
jgi:putative MATE family efflux protein